MCPRGTKIVGKVERRGVGEQDRAVDEGEGVDGAEDGGVTADDGDRGVAAYVSVTLDTDTTVDHESARRGTRGRHIGGTNVANDSIAADVSIALNTDTAVDHESARTGTRGRNR